MNSIEPFLIRDVYMVLDQFQDQAFQEGRVSVRSNLDRLTGGCIAIVLKNACKISFSQEEDPVSLFTYQTLQGFYLDEREDVITEDRRVDREFIQRIKKFSHVYLHYLWQGWSPVESLSMRAKWGKKERFSFIRSEADLAILAKKVKISISIAFIRCGRGGEEQDIEITGISAGLRKFFAWIQAEAENTLFFPISVSPAILRARQIGEVAKFHLFMQAKMEETNQECLVESQRFLTSSLDEA